MPLEPYLRCLPQLQHIFAAMANNDLEWLFADREHVLQASPQAKEVLGLEPGDAVGQNPWLAQVRDSGSRVLHHQRGWRGNNAIVFTLVGVPVKEDSGEVLGLFFYAMVMNHSPLQPEHILQLLQEMNSEQDLESGLYVLTQRSLKLFQASMAGIWLKH